MLYSKENILKENVYFHMEVISVIVQVWWISMDTDIVYVSQIWFLLNKPLLLLNIWLCIFWLFDSLSSQLCYWLIVELLKSRKLKMWSIISIFDLYIIVYFGRPSELFIQTPSLVVVVLTESTSKKFSTLCS
jgi:hypothetical protein